MANNLSAPYDYFKVCVVIVEIKVDQRIVNGCGINRLSSSGVIRGLLDRLFSFFWLILEFLAVSAFQIVSFAVILAGFAVEYLRAGEAFKTSAPIWTVFTVVSTADDWLG